MAKSKRYTVEIELDSVEIDVTAKTKAEAKSKALKKLKKKNITSLIGRSFPDNKRKIWIDEVFGQ